MGGKHKRKDSGRTFIKNASHFSLPSDLKPALAESQPFNSLVSNVVSSFSSSICMFFVFYMTLHALNARICIDRVPVISSNFCGMPMFFTMSFKMQNIVQAMHLTMLIAHL